MKIKAIIVDDEKSARILTSNLCEKLYKDKIEIISECSSVTSALESIKKHSLDLVFLDIQMPGENGFDLLLQLDEIPFEIIFTTAHSEHAIRAIKYSALDYLVKPFDEEDFKTAIDKLDFALEKKHNSEKYKLLKETIKSPEKPRIAFPTKSGFDVVHTNEILFCESDGVYTDIQTKEHKINVSRSLKEVCETLEFEKKFLRVHKRFLINAEYVTKFKSEDFTLIMTSGHEIQVSDKKFTKKNLIDAITK